MTIRINFFQFKFLKISLCALLLIYATKDVSADKTDTLFQSDEVISMELRSDFSAIENERTGNPGYHDGELVYHNAKGETINLSVKVMARGNFRRNPKNCNFPPLFLNFKKNEVKNTLFDKQDKLKLVTPCQDEQDVIDEYTIYKMYNLVTDLSLKVRLVKILYFNTSNGKKVFEKYSFFIEEKDRFEKRNNSFEIEKSILPFDLNGENIKRVSFFQYMIGNKDWFYHTRHNILLMQPNDTSKAPYAVPYDFDFSDFVNADYTKPKEVDDELLDNRRIYKGLCYSPAELDEIFKFFRDLKPVFETLINNMTYISRSNKKMRIKYIEYFYSVIKSKKLIRQEFLDVCETKKTYGLSE